VTERPAVADDPIVIPGRYVEWFGWALNVAVPLFVVGMVALLMGLANRPAWLAAGIVLLVVCAAALGVCAWSFTRPARLTLSQEGFALTTPAYTLWASWDNVAAIGVEDAARQPGLVILFDDPEAVLRTARPRREGNFVGGGYHLRLPGNLLRWDADRIAQWMAEAREGEPWEAEA
jgi:hypothetical protein